MNISEEIKRMMSLLESETGNVKPLITEEGPVTAVDEATEVLTRAMSAQVNGKSCWDEKGFVWDKTNPFTFVNENYLYALNKVDPSIKAGYPFVKIKKGDAEFYMFGIPSINPQYLGGYLAVGRNNTPFNKDKPDPNQSYLSSNGWKCDSTFNISKNAASQGELLTVSQDDAIKKITDAKTYLNNTGYNFYDSVPIGADSNYLKVDVATGRDENGEQRIRQQDIDLMKTQNYGFTPGKFFLYMSVGASTQNTDLVKSAQAAIKKMGYTHIEPEDAGSSQALSKTTVAELCAGNNVCSDILKKYIEKNNINIWPMTSQQRADAAKNGITVDDQSTFSDKMNDTNRFKVGRSIQQGLNSLADKKSCQTGIALLDFCNTVNNNGLCEKQIDDMEAKGLISLGQTGFTNKINAIKTLLGFCVKNKEINLNNKYEGMLTNLQALSGQYGLATPVNSTQTDPNARPSDVFESLDNSIKSVISETINKNNNNLDSIIKKNLRRYIR